ncbi:MAG: threonine/serine exporter family protein [Firmicutes bacterium]|nr:threonine/serine exporter family protein [Bacillota bacterium]
MDLDFAKILLYTFMACFGFCIVLHMNSPLQMVAACMGGVIGWAIYLLLSPGLQETVCYLIASIAVTLYCECMARIFKEPVTGFLLIGIIPMVPGGPIYYTMEYCINGETDLFLESFLRTFGIAGALAVGVLFVSSSMNLYRAVRSSIKSKHS